MVTQAPEVLGREAVLLLSVTCTTLNALSVNVNSFFSDLKPGHIYPYLAGTASGHENNILIDL